MALVSVDPRFGNANLGLIVDPDGLTLVDTLATPPLALAADAEIAELTEGSGRRLKRVVLTSSRIPHTGGTSVFWRSAFYSSEAVSDQMDLPVNPDLVGRLIPQHRHAYGPTFLTRPVTHTIREAALLTEAAAVHLVPGEGAANVVVQVPTTGVVFLGALGSFGVTPLAFDGDPAVWADSLDTVAGLGSLFVPGHGMPAGEEGLAAQAAYLRACVAADGDPSALPAGPWDRWTDRRFDAVNVERAARLADGDATTPTAMLDLLGL